MKFSNLLQEYKEAVENGDSIAVINRFYREDITQVENNELPVQGKEKLLQLEKASIEKVHSFELKITSMLVDEAAQKVMGEMQVKFNSKKGGRKKFCEAFVQQWEQEQIKYQRFYYGAIETDE